MKILNKNKNKKRKGFALTEVLMAIAVIIIIGIAAYPLYKHARVNADVEKYNTLIVSLNDYVVKNYSSQPSTAGLDSTFLTLFDNSTGLLSQDNLNQPGAIELEPFSTTKGYVIAIENGMPLEDCVGLVSDMLPQFDVVVISTGQASGGSSSITNSNIIKNTATNTVATPATISNACSTANGANFMKMTVGNYTI
jgi:Tfp pilus assembly protein PilE